MLGLIGGPLMISSVIGQIIGINEQYSDLVGDRPHPDLHLGAVARPVDDLQGFPQGLPPDGRGRRDCEPGRIAGPPPDRDPGPEGRRRRKRAEHRTLAHANLESHRA